MCACMYVVCMCIGVCSTEGSLIQHPGNVSACLVLFRLFSHGMGSAQNILRFRFNLFATAVAVARFNDEAVVLLTSKLLSSNELTS